MHITQFMGGLRADVTLFRISETAGRIALKFVVVRYPLPGTYLGFAQGGRGGGGYLRELQGYPPPKSKTLRIWATIFWEWLHFTN